MMRLFVCAVAVLVMMSANGQKKRSAIKVKQSQAKILNPGCTYRNRYSVKERLAFYPFCKAKEVRLVSFESVFANALRKADSAAMEGLAYKEQLTLSHELLDSLTAILFNYSYSYEPEYFKGRRVVFAGGETNCYDPRHRVLFVDSADKVFAFIELCFHCSKYKTSSDEVRTGYFCIQKYDYLKAFFSYCGIKQGLNE